MSLYQKIIYLYFGLHEKETMIATLLDVEIRKSPLSRHTKNNRFYCKLSPLTFVHHVIETELTQINKNKLC